MDMASVELGGYGASLPTAFYLTDNFFDPSSACPALTQTT